MNHPALRVFDGSANPELTDEICDCLDIEKGCLEVKRFSDGESHILVNESVRGADVFIVQPTCAPTNENLMTLLITIDAMKRASAARITAVIPYYGYSRQEKKTAGREPITAKLVANLLTTAGVNRVVSVDLHTWAIQGFFDIPVDHLSALPTLVDHLESLKVPAGDMAIVSPDAGGVARARAFAKKLGASLAIIDKRRPRPNESEVMHLVGDVNGKVAVLVDDMIDTAGTVCAGATMLKAKGASRILAVATHPVLSGPARARIMDSPIEQLIVTNSIRGDGETCAKVKVLSIAPILAEVIYRIYNNLSVSNLFE